MNISPINFYSYSNLNKIQNAPGFKRADEKQLSEKEKNFLENRRKLNEKCDRTEQRIKEQEKRNRVRYIYDDETIKEFVCNKNGTIDIDKLKSTARIASKIDNIIKGELSAKTIEKYGNTIAYLKRSIIQNLIDAQKVYNGDNFSMLKVETDFDNWTGYVEKRKEFLDENMSKLPLKSIPEKFLPSDTKDIERIEGSSLYQLFALTRYNIPRLTPDVSRKY